MSGYGAGMLTTCSEHGCRTIVMGEGRCLVHEPHVVRVFLRGRPFVSTASRIQAARDEAVSYVGPDSRRASELRTA
jgi:hypothetical protein